MIIGAYTVTLMNVEVDIQNLVSRLQLPSGTERLQQLSDIVQEAESFAALPLCMVESASQRDAEPAFQGAFSGQQ